MSEAKINMLDLCEQYLSVRGEIRRAIDAVCDAQAFVLGPTTESFEKKLAEYCGTRYALGVSSGTDALLCALMALDIKAGDEVICPAFTFFATAGVIARLGAKPVFADIDPQTFNLDPQTLGRHITPRTRAIIPVDLYGQCADYRAINAIASQHNLAVVEDAAQAIGACQGSKKAASLATMGCLSFYPTKNLGAFGDAGAICTDDQELYQKCELLRLHGSGHRNTYYHKIVGGMFRMDALQAAVLNVKIKHLDQWHEGRRRNAALYDKLLAGSKAQTPMVAPGNWHIYNQYVVRLPNRDAVKAHLASKGIGSAIYYPLPLHKQECFADLGYHDGDFPHSEQACREVLALPIYPELVAEQIERVAAEVLAALRV